MLLIFLPAILIPAYALSSLAFHMMYSAYTLNKQGDNIQPWCSPFSICNQSIVPCFFTCTQISQEAGNVVWYFHHLKNFVVIHTVKGFGIVNEAEDGFLEFSCFFYDPMDVGNLISDSSAFSKSSLNIWFRCSDTSWFRYCWSLAWRIWSITLLVYEMSTIVQ